MNKHKKEKTVDSFILNGINFHSLGKNYYLEGF